MSLLNVVNVTTNVCHNIHYFCVVTFTTKFVVNVTTLTMPSSDIHYKK